MLFSTTGFPQRGQVPTVFVLETAERLPLLFSKSTISVTFFMISEIKLSALPTPFSISDKACSQRAVSSADLTFSGKEATNFLPYSVEISCFFLRSMYPAAISSSIIAALVAGVPRPLSFTNSLNALSGIRRSMFSITARSVLSVNRFGGYVSPCFTEIFSAVNVSFSE